MRRLSALAAAAALLAGCSAQPAATPSRDVKPAQMTVEYTWVRTTTDSRDPSMTGAFMSLSNPSENDITLTACQAEVAGMCEIHEMVAGADGKKVMQKAEKGVTVPKGGHLHLEPGSYHVMLMKLTKPLPVGEEVPISLTFSDGNTVEIKAPVKKFTEEADHYHASASPSPATTPSS